MHFIFFPVISGMERPNHIVLNILKAYIPFLLNHGQFSSM